MLLDIDGKNMESKRLRGRAMKNLVIIEFPTLLKKGKQKQM